MKKITTLLAVTLIAVSTLTAQDRISESNLLGTWKMKIDAEKVMDEISDEADEEDNLLAKVILKSVSGLMEGVLDNMDIYITFKKGGDAIVTIDVFDSDDKQKDKARWRVRGTTLYIEDVEDGGVDWEGDGEWRMKDGVLILDQDEDEMSVYMVRVDG